TPEGPGIVLDGKILTQLVLVELEHDRRRVAFPLEDLSDPETCPRPWEMNQFIEEKKPKKKNRSSRQNKNKINNKEKGAQASSQDEDKPKKKRRKRRRRKRKQGKDSDKG
ncbi:MAG: hypothetical protein HOC27_07575, partial [Phycisphaerae bacterium]|nr:hypothetical protein [Phycisphaerae bacterium]